jgi:arylformamidase
MMLAAQWPRYGADLPEKTVEGALSISGVYDLTPIVNVPSVNNDVRLTEQSAINLSPAFMPPATDAPLYVAVGGREIEGFRQQHEEIRQAWASVIAEDVACPADNHFSILDTFTNPASDLFKAALRMMKIG